MALIILIKSTKKKGHCGFFYAVILVELYILTYIEIFFRMFR